MINERNKKLKYSKIIFAEEKNPKSEIVKIILQSIFSEKIILVLELENISKVKNVIIFYLNNYLVYISLLRE